MSSFGDKLKRIKNPEAKAIQQAGVKENHDAAEGIFASLAAQHTFSEGADTNRLKARIARAVRDGFSERQSEIADFLKTMGIVGEVQDNIIQEIGIAVQKVHAASKKANRIER